MRIDAYSHVLPRSYLQMVQEGGAAASRMVHTWIQHRALSDREVRVALLDEFEIDVQVVTPTVPPVDALAEKTGHDARVLAACCNDGIAEWVSASEGRFVGVGTLSLLDPRGAIEEAERIVKELGLVGVQLCCGPEIPPLESENLDDLFSLMEELDAAVWLHPWQSLETGRSGAEFSPRRQVPYVLGWPYETAVAAFCLAASGLLVRHPRLRCVLHHAGGVIAPLWGRIEWLYTEEWAEVRGQEAIGADIVLDSVKRFYVDTATGGSHSALSSALDSFGPDRVVFGTDAPYGPRHGADAIERAISGIMSARMDDVTRERIWAGNAEALLGTRARALLNI